MLNKTRSSRRHTWKYLLIVPALTITAGLLSASNPPLVKVNGEKYIQTANGNTYVILTPKTTDEDLKVIKQIMREKKLSLNILLLQRNTDGDISDIEVGNPIYTIFLFKDVVNGRGIGDGTVDGWPENLLHVAAEESVVLITDSLYKKRFPGGADAFLKFISKNIRYPLASHIANASGAVTAQFQLSPDGSVKGVKVINAARKDMGQEVERILNTLPKFDAAPSGKTETILFTVVFLMKDEYDKHTEPDLSKVKADILVIGYGVLYKQQ